MEIQMIENQSRRKLLQFAGAMIPLAGLRLTAELLPFEKLAASPVPDAPAIGELFPTQPPELIREMVLVSHFNLNRVKELVGARPSLARAAWDWGFGDWEEALGAASHMGNRAIAEFLIANGARPSLFSATMFGQLDVVKAFIAANPGAQKIRGPHGISLIAHAKSGGEAARPVFDYLQSLGDADVDPLIPVSDEDLTAIAGTYNFGSGATQQIELLAEKRQGLMAMYSPLTWTRKGTMGRPLVHLGNRTFYPAGAPAVRIRFAEEKDTVVMTIYDPDLVLTARRNPVVR
jgi:hypothetical protein